MKPVNRSSVNKAVTSLLELTSARKVTVYQSPDVVVKATRQRKPTKRSRTETILVTLGAPNFAERKFIKQCKTAGVNFPVREPQLKFYPAKK